MYLNNNSYRTALVPSREKRFTPDETEHISDVGSANIVSVAEARKFLPVHDNDSDGNIQALINAVTSQVENFIGKDLYQKKVRSYWMSVPQVAKLSRGPVDSIDEVKVVDKNTGEETILTEDDDYRVEGISFKRLKWISAESGELFVEYTVGYASGKYPPEAKGGILQELALQFKNRQDPDTAPMTSVNNLSIEARHLLVPIARMDY